MTGKLYGIGIGPGDPELVTIKGARLLGEAHVVAVPKTGDEKESLALKIAGGYINPGTEILTLIFPMTRDDKEKIRIRHDNAMFILAKLEEGKNVAFITLGDPMLYSTFIYIAGHLKERGVEIETVPGITSFSAICCSRNIPAAEGNETLTLVPLHRNTDIERVMEENDNIVFMKVSSDSARLGAELKKYEKEREIIIATRCGSDDEEFSGDPGVLNGEIPYLTTVIVKKKAKDQSGRKNQLTDDTDLHG